MKTVVSVSLGSSSRDHESRIELLGETVHLSRRGVDGRFKRAVELLQELDGAVDAIGLGGIDIYLKSRSQTFELRDGVRLRDTVQKTPVVDGSGLKNTLERETVRHLQESGTVPLAGKKVLMVCAMDRFGMAEALDEVGANTVYGDMIFNLNLDKPILTLDELEERASKLLPEICKLPISMVYPTGKKQDLIEPTELTAPYFQEAEIIAGDFHIIRRRLPERLEGKGVLTNTVTENDAEELRKRGVAWLVTTTPELDGRSFGTNVLEAALLAHLGKTWDEVIPEDYLALIREAGLLPRVVRFD
ncbi:MAG: quinate 5-dehydrogenase [Vulcanimicrobiota bacterium]